MSRLGEALDWGTDEEAVLTKVAAGTATPTEVASVPAGDVARATPSAFAWGWVVAGVVAAGLGVFLGLSRGRRRRSA